MSCISSTPIPMVWSSFITCLVEKFIIITSLNSTPRSFLPPAYIHLIFPAHIYISDYELGNKKKENRKWHYIHTQSNLKMYRCSRFFITFEDNKRQPCIDGIKLYMPNTISLSRHLQYIPIFLHIEI